MIIKIKPCENGGHFNQHPTPKNIPEGWAIVPNDMETPNFPFGEVEVEEIGGVMIVTKWIPGVIPEPTPEPEPEVEPLDIDEFANAILEGVNEV